MPITAVPIAPTVPECDALPNPTMAGSVPSKLPFAAVKPNGERASQSWKLFTKKNTWVAFWNWLVRHELAELGSHEQGNGLEHGVLCEGNVVNGYLKLLPWLGATSSPASARSSAAR